METRQFKAESKRLLDIVINSIYTHKEIFLRELISNASDATDKIYYKALTDSSIEFKKDDYYIKLFADKDSRTLKIVDTGIGMTKEDLDENLGTIAKSGSFNFKSENEIKDGHDIIGQFGVGFYSAFLVADRVSVISRPFGSGIAYKWESQGIEGYTIEECQKDSVGTEIILKLKEDTEDENYSQYLEEYRLRNLIKKYSDFIRYPIKMDASKSKLKDGSESDYEHYTEEETINSMVPIWKKNKSELKEDDYENFYSEKRYGFDKPLSHLHLSVDGSIRYNALLFIPEKTPFDFYTKDYEKGLELYSNGVMIMEKCSDLLPDHFGFVKGIVDSEDLSLNISREILQHDRQLKFIAKNIKNKIRNELKSMIRNDREKYENFYSSFGKQLKYGTYSDFGANKDDLQDLLMFYSSSQQTLVTLGEYVSRMPEDQKFIYYATGESNDKISKMPQTEIVLDRGYEILYFTDEIDEFAIKVISSYSEKEFKSVSSSDLGIENDDALDSSQESQADSLVFAEMKNFLAGKVKEVRASKRLKKHPVCLANDGDLSIEMEKILQSMPDSQGLRAEKILEINPSHDVFESLKKAHESDSEKFRLFTDILYNQALLIEGLSIEDPVEFTSNICKIMK